MEADSNENKIVEGEDTLWDKLPTTFTNIENWPRQTNIRCWFCTLKFKSTPWFIITSINQTPDGKIMNTKGNFCSCGCLMGFVKKNYSKREDFDIYHNVYTLYKIITGKKKLSIKESPDIYNLKIYGGNMSIEKYKEELEKVNILNTIG